MQFQLNNGKKIIQKNNFIIPLKNVSNENEKRNGIMENEKEEVVSV